MKSSAESNNPLAWDIPGKPDKTQIEEARKKTYEDDIHFLAAFSTDSGKKVMEWMVKHTLDTPTWWPQGDYDKAIANGFWREGQNSLVRQIKAKIENARTYQENK